MKKLVVVEKKNAKKILQIKGQIEKHLCAAKQAAIEHERKDEAKVQNGVPT